MVILTEAFVDAVAQTAFLIEPIADNDYYVEGSLWDIIDAWEAFN